MTSKVGPKGQVVIPKEIRDDLGIRPGDEVTFARVAGGAQLRAIKPEARLQGLLADADLEPLDELWQRHKAEERALEERKDRLLGGLDR